MHFSKQMGIFALCIFAVSSFVFSNNLSAAFIGDPNGFVPTGEHDPVIKNGQLAGAKNVLVDGIRYDFTIRDGDYLDVYGANPEIIVNSDLQEAFDLAIFFTAGILYDVYQNPEQILGCDGTFGYFEYCSIFYAHKRLDGGTSIGGIDVGLGPGEIPTPIHSGGFFADGDRTNVAYGVWSLSATTVPLPATAWLFGSALLGVLGLKRKRN